MNKSSKIIGIVIMSIFILVNFTKLISQVIILVATSPTKNFERGNMLGSSIGNLLLIILFIIGIIKLAKSLSNE